MTATFQLLPACYAEVAVNAPTPHHLTFTYAVPPGMAVAVGQAVWVPFGTRLAQGFIFALTPTPRVEAPRPLAGAVAGQPCLAPWQVDLAGWISRYYGSSLFEAAALFMPPDFERRVLTLVHPVPATFGRVVGTLTPRQRRILRSLDRHGPTELEDLKRRVADRRAAEVVDQLVQQGLARKELVVQRPRVGPKHARVLCRTESPAPPVVLDRSPRQAALLSALEAAGGRLTRAALREGGFTAAVSAGLVRKGLVHWEAVREVRAPLVRPPGPAVPVPTLTAAQEQAWAALRQALDQPPDARGPQVFLLHGVTGSGKTEIYLRALAHVIAQGRRGIVLVPEIALTPQTVERVAARFPGRVALLHSGLSLGQQFDAWWRIHDGEFDVVVGSRSAVFAPQADLGLIVVDEEHDAAYKQTDPAPRYHARRVAEEVARRTGAVLVLGSATPDLGSYLQALAGRFHVLELPARVSPHRSPGPSPLLSSRADRWHGVAAQEWSRFPFPLPLGEGEGGAGKSALTPTLSQGEREPPPAFTSQLAAPELQVGKGGPGAEEGGASALRGLPSVEIVDLRRELREGNRSIFSRSLTLHLAATLEAGHQAILFLNRRGAASFVQCRDCGHAMTCRRCDVALTYHSVGERLLCHQCSAQVAVPGTCPHCASPRIKFLGLGTQRVEEEVGKLFPAARVLRWDRDTARTRSAHETALRRFQDHEADVLVGTQMIAKGLDLPQVTLVGVVNADITLYLPDFRAAERTFQLLTQVAGRAGRGPWAGQVIVQTYTPEHYALTTAARQDYRAFAQQEAAYRRRHGYPPFGRMARLLFAHPGAARAQHEAEALARRLREEAATAGLAEVAVLGPVPAYPRRVRGRYRWQIVLLGGDPHPLLERIVVPRGWLLDVDPVGLL
ncbi:MAG: primosomal protein N' [Chloroflexi bacterium]|nr:primosomal protein N' [Chloroflexota bacterium]